MISWVDESPWFMGYAKWATQVWRPITVSTVLTLEQIPEKGRQLKKTKNMIDTKQILLFVLFLCRIMDRIPNNFRQSNYLTKLSGPTALTKCYLVNPKSHFSLSSR